VIALLAALALAEPTSEELHAAWQPVRQILASDGTYALDWDQDDFEQMVKGKVAKRRERLDGTDRVIGVVWSPHPRDVVWVAVQDDEHWDVVSGLVDEDLPGTTPDSRILFQHLELPWPFTNRQWTIRVVNNTELITKTKGSIWERTWGLDPTRGATAEEDGAVWVDVNDGGWLAIDLLGGTLLAYHVRTRIGGNVPDEVAVQYAYSTLGGMLKEIARRADEETLEHYVGDHRAIRRPDGTHIAVFK